MKVKMTHLIVSVFFVFFYCNIFIINAFHTIENHSIDISEVKNVYLKIESSDIYEPIVDKEQNAFDLSSLNYTGLRLAMDDILNSTNSRTGKFLGSCRIPKFLSGLSKLVNLDTFINEIETSIPTSVSCNACRLGIGILQHCLETEKTEMEIMEAAIEVCSTLKIETPRVCNGIIHLMIHEVIYVAENVYATADTICGLIIGDVCGIPFDPYYDWNVTFPPIPKPPIKPITLKQDAVALKVLQISDTHFDPEYIGGSNADCGEPLCCRATSGHPHSKEQQAKPWGDYRNCDTPKRTIFNMLEHIAQVHTDIDYILWTGDLPPHDVWNQSKTSNTNIIKETVQQMLSYFPNTPIFPAIGNHESTPVNSFPSAPDIPEEYGVDWLYKVCHDEWLRWLPQETGLTILKGGFYSVLVKPKFRIISINTNFCNNKNWWLLANSTDPAQELEWLINELQGAESRGERVHIIGHIPPGHSDCFKVWSRNYNKIVNRYESTIAGQFFGHTHHDEYEIFYDSEDPKRATGMAYIGPSVTTYTGLNPGYRIYYIQDDKMVINHETWIMNLDEANEVGLPRWYQLYSAQAAYGLRSLHPQEWDNVIDKMSENDELFDMYYRFYWKNSPVRKNCNEICKKRLLCDLKSGRSRDRKVTCATIYDKLGGKQKKGWREWIISGITTSITSIASWFF